MSMRALSLALLLGALPIAVTAPPVAAQPLPGTSCALFPSDNVLNTDISRLPVSTQSATWMSNMTQNANLHPDFGTFAQQYGIPLNIAPPPAATAATTATPNPIALSVRFR